MPSASLIFRIIFVKETSLFELVDAWRKLNVLGDIEAYVSNWLGLMALKIEKFFDIEHINPVFLMLTMKKAYLGPCQTPMMECFVKVVSGF